MLDLGFQNVFVEIALSSYMDRETNVVFLNVFPIKKSSH